MTLYIFGFPQSFGCDRACNDLTRFPVDAFFSFSSFFVSATTTTTSLQ
jgi:hypothetical protein